MTTNYHTPITTGAAGNSSVVNSPLAQLDAELTDQGARITVVEGDIPVPSGVVTEYFDGSGVFSVPAGTGAGIDGHLVQDEGVGLPQRAVLNFVGTGVSVTNEVGGTQVRVPGASDDGWIAESSVWIYSSVDSPTGIISANADITGKIQKGTRLKYNQSEPLTAYFPMDVSSTSTVGSFTSVNQNAPTYTAGKFGNALTLVSASSQCVEITDMALIKPVGDFTIGAWIKTSTSGVLQSIFASYSANTALAGINIRVEATGTVSLLTSKNTGTIINADFSAIYSTKLVNDGAMHYVVFCYRNNYGQIYIDGVLDGYGFLFTPAYSATNYVRIGARSTSGTNTNFFNGQIDDLFLINGYALDEETIKAKYVAQTAQGTSNITVAKKAIVTNVGAYSGSNTLITAYHGTDFGLSNAAITSPCYSGAKIPFGFNANPDKWTVLFEDKVTRSQVPVSGTVYNLGSLSLSVPIGLWDVVALANVACTYTSVAVLEFVSVNFNFSNSSITLDASSFRGNYKVPSPIVTNGMVDNTMIVFGIINLYSKTTYYLLSSTTNAAGTLISLAFNGATVVTMVRCKSAYL